MPANCPICLEALSNGHTVRTDCGHHFHRKCLTRWVETGYTRPDGNFGHCPVCRENILSNQMGTLGDRIEGTIANFHVLTIPGLGLGVVLDADDLAL